MPPWPIFRVTFDGRLSEADAGALSATDADPETPPNEDRQHSVTLGAPDADSAIGAVQRVLVDGPYRNFNALAI